MKILNVPQKYIGIPFVENGASFEGANCLGVSKLFVENELGVKVTQLPPDIQKAQSLHDRYRSLIEPISFKDLEPGDVPFFAFRDRWHCGVYVGYGKILHTVKPLFATTKTRSMISAISSTWEKNYIGAIRAKGKTEIVVPDAGDLGTVITIISIVMTIGSMIYSAVASPKSPTLDFGNDTGSPKYGFDALSNTISNEVIYPIHFGYNKYAGNIPWYKNDGETTHRIIIVGIGQIQSITDVRVNDIPIGDLPGCSYTAYLGTPDQTVDSRASADVKGLRNVAYIAVTLQSSEQLPGGNPTITYMVEGLIMKTWDGSIWSGATYSRNPAACVRKLLTILREDGGPEVAETEFDDASFGEVYDYFVTAVDNGAGGTHARCQFDYVFDAEKPIHDVLSDIMQAYGMYLTIGEKISLHVMKAESSAYDFDMDNIEAGSFKYYEASKDDSYNWVIVKYADPDQNDVGVDVKAIDKYDIIQSGNVRPGEFDFRCISRFAEAARRAEFIKNKSLINKIFCEFTVNIEALHNTVGDVVTVTHDLPAWDHKPFRIIDITEETNSSRKVILVEENSSIYNDAMSSVIETYDYGSPPNPYAPVDEVTGLSIVESDCYVHKDGTVSSDIIVSWTAPAGDSSQFLKYYQIELKKGSEGYKTIGFTAATDFTIFAVEDEVTYYVRVKTVSINDVVSSGVESLPLTVLGKLSPPGNVANFSYTFLDEIVLKWDRNTEKDLGGYEIRLEDADWGVQNSNLVYNGLANKFTIVSPTSRTPGTFYIKAFDTSGNYSTTAASVTPTNAAPAAPTISVLQWFGFAKIAWSDVSDVDLKYYEVYKSNTNAWAGEETLAYKIPGTAVVVQGNAPADAIADSVGATGMTDATLIGKGVNYFVGDIITQTSGDYKGQFATITAFDNDTGEISVASWPSGTPDIGDQFVIKDRAYYKVKGVDSLGPGTASSAVTIDFTPLAESEISDEAITARKLIAGELITLSAQIKDLVVTDAKIASLDGGKITAESITLSKLASDAIPPKTYYQDDAPTTGMNEGDYWIDTNDSNKLYVYQSSAWVVISQSGGGGGVTTFRQSTCPTATSAGDLWIDSDDSKLYRATNAGDDQVTAGEWVLIDAAVATGWAHSSDTTKIDGGNIYTGSVTADKITASQIDAIAANTGTLTVDEYINVGDGHLKIDGANKVIKVYDASNNLRVELGLLS